MEEEEKRMKRDELIDELIEEVVLRLPPPSVARFKSISKWWRQYLSEPPFVDRYEARNLSLLGFFYQASYNKFVFRAIPSNPNNKSSSSSSISISRGNRLRTSVANHCGASDNTLLVINSCNGLLLLYSSMPVPYYEVYNPTTGDKVSVRFSYNYETFATRYMVFGFAFDPYSTHPCFTIVDIADTGARKFRVFSYSSLRSCWRTTYHTVPSNVRDGYALSGRSTFCRGALHWLLEPSGVVSFDVRTKTISFSLINLPGDDKYLDDHGLCICVKKMRDAGLYSNGYCSCRYLGVSGDDLIYIRVTGHSQLSLWALNCGTWSHTSVINVGNLPESLFLGCVLEFRKMETPLLYLRVKRRIFSYSLINGVLQELFRITKEYGGGDNCLGFIIPYQLPRISLSIPSITPQDSLSNDASFDFLFNAVKQLQADPLAITEDTLAHPKAYVFLARAKSIVRRLNNDGLIHLYSQLGICQVAAKCFPHLQHVEFDPTGIPVWSFYNLHAPLTSIGLRDTVVKYNDFIRVEGCLYGCTAKHPFSITTAMVNKTIGNSLLGQYKRWQPKAHYELQIDPTVGEVKRKCNMCRLNANSDRVLFHYNGHGVPKPTANGEIWVFNKGCTQYIPLSVSDLDSWLKTPSIYVFDCSAAGMIVNALTELQECNLSGPSSSSMKDCILLAACEAHESLPQHAGLPADVFTSCLTTPIKMALSWFCPRSLLRDAFDPTIIDKIPGHPNDRKSLLGELNWIFTAVTDTIAWNVLPHDTFQRLFRQDLLVASLFRNFLLAERIMRSTNCSPISYPLLPQTHWHHMWDAWDMAVETCLKLFVKEPEAEFQPSSFFDEQLTAFEVWLDFGSQHKKPPEQLPIVLWVLLSQSHRFRALFLLGRFLDMGPWAVNLILSVGNFPCVLKLLKHQQQT